MRYLTPDTPSRRLLEQAAKTADTMTDATASTPTPTTTPTPTPTPALTPTPEAASTVAAPSRDQQPPRRRRAIRTYGSKKRTLDDAGDRRTKRPRTALAAAAAAEAVPPAASSRSPTATTITSSSRPCTPTMSERALDEVSQQLQQEAAEAERRQCEETKKEDKENAVTLQTNKTSTTRPQTPRKSPRKPLGIMRYFQPAAAAPRTRSPPPALQVACSPAASISSMSSLSSCPSPTSPLSACSIRGDDEVGSNADDGGDAEETDAPLSPMEWRTQRPRQKRRLTIRPDRVGWNRDDEADGADRGEASGENSNDRPTDLGSSPIVAAFNGMSSSSRMRRQLFQKAAATTETATTTTTTNARQKHKTVQTTLSLAIGPSDSGSVRECKACNILYNPLHETDAKFHARYHASVVGKVKRV